MSDGEKNNSQDLLGSILSNPELLGKVAGIIKELGIGGTKGGSAGGTGNTSEHTDESDDDGVWHAPEGSAEDSVQYDSGEENGKDDGYTKGFPGGFASLLANKELMSKLPGILSALGVSVPGGKNNDSTPAENSEETVAAGAFGHDPQHRPHHDHHGPPHDHHGPHHDAHGKGGFPVPHGKGRHDKRTALLIALKPYLNKQRREVVDYFIKIGKLGDLFGAFK